MPNKNPKLVVFLCVCMYLCVCVCVRVSLSLSSTHTHSISHNLSLASLLLPVSEALTPGGEASLSAGSRLACKATWRIQVGYPPWTTEMLAPAPALGCASSRSERASGTKSGAAASKCSRWWLSNETECQTGCGPGSSRAGCSAADRASAWVFWRLPSHA